MGANRGLRSRAARRKRGLKVLLVFDLTAEGPFQLPQQLHGADYLGADSIVQQQRRCKRAGGDAFSENDRIGRIRRSGGRISFSPVWMLFCSAPSSSAGNRIAEQYTDDIGRSEALTQEFRNRQSDRRATRLTSASPVRSMAAVSLPIAQTLCTEKPPSVSRRAMLCICPFTEKSSGVAPGDVDGVFSFFHAPEGRSALRTAAAPARARDIRADAVGGNEGRNAGPAFDFPGNGSKVAASDHRNRRSGKGQ